MVTLRQVDLVKEVVRIQPLTDIVEVVEVPQTVSAKPPEPTVVLVRGLPTNLCEVSCVAAIMEQAGLDGNLGGISVRKGTGFAEASLTLSDKETAHQVVKHFEGCQWYGFRVTAVLSDGNSEANSKDLTDVPDGARQIPPEIAMPACVALRGLPELLWDELSLHAILEQAQLADFLVSISVPENGERGEASLTLVNRHAAEKCVKHFARCRWVGCCVSAHIVEPSCEGDPTVCENVSKCGGSSVVVVTSLNSTLQTSSAAPRPPGGLDLSSVCMYSRFKSTPTASSGGSTKLNWADMSDDDDEEPSTCRTIGSGWEP